MDLNTPKHVPAFAKVLRSFQTGGVTYEDLLAHIDREVAAGESRAALLDILRRREYVEPLADAVREAVVSRIETAPGAPPAGPATEADAPTASVPAAAAPADTAEPAAAADDADGDTLPDPPRVAAREHSDVDALLADLPPFEASVDASVDAADMPGEVPITAEQPTIVLDDATGDEAPVPAQPAEQAGPKTGDVIKGRYRLLSLLGEGGMSRVYKAVDLQQAGIAAAESILAVKVLTRPVSDEAESFEALTQDIALLQRLNHPGIVRMFGCDRDGDTVFITMEFLAGQSLYGKLRTGRLDGQPSGPLQGGEARSIVCAMGAALEYAHANHVVHGDLKPGNVILAADNGVKIIDFGLATWIGRPKTALERREAAVAYNAAAVTPRYASPQLMARQKSDATDDVYALACIAYELLSGSHPFEQRGGGGSPRFPPPRKAGISRGQYLALLHGLQFERRNRTPTVARFVEEFSAAQARTRWLPWAVGVAAVAAIALGWAWLRAPSGRPEPLPSSVALPPAEPAPSVAPVSAPASARAALPAVPVAAGGVLRDCPTCPQMTLLPTGSFKQGAAADDMTASPFARPQHTVQINYPFAVSTNAVTVGNFREFIAATGRNMQGCETYDGQWRQHAKSGWKSPGFEQSDDHPVTCTSWNDALAYAHWLSTKSGHRYRLPTASEWEYAARAGRPTATPWSTGAAACQEANVADTSAALRYPGWHVFACSDGFVHTAPVGSFKANPFGLNDMLGNVFVWTQDCWHEDYQGAPQDGSARLDGDCGEHELRGGSWFSSPGYVTVAYRNHFPAGYRTSSVGIRLVREPGP